jgi:hypothetical protein
MPRKPNPNNNYFNSSVEEAIHAYNICDDEREKNKLFAIIYPALAKLSEVWRNKIKPTYIEIPPDELEMDCITFMLEKLHMVKEGKGKAFSYLTVTSRNYYIQENMKWYAKHKKNPSIDALSDNYDIEDVPSNRVEEMEASAKLFDTFIEYINDNFDEIFPTKKHKLFANVFMEKVRTKGLSLDFNRRKFLNEVSAETGIERGSVTKQVNRVASQFTIFKEYYDMYGTKPEFKEKKTISDKDAEYIRKHYQHYSKTYGVNGISRKLGIPYDVVLDWVNQSTL